MFRILNEEVSAIDLLRKKKTLKRRLLQDKQMSLQKRILILSGSTIGEIASFFEIFCLEQGIEIEIIQGEYNRFFEDAVYGNEDFENLKPDFIYVHVSNRNLSMWPLPYEAEDSIKEKVEKEFKRIETVISTLQKKYVCPIIYNNFEELSYRIMGNKDVWEVSGRHRFISCINECLYDYARKQEGVYIQDIAYLASHFGLTRWNDPIFWYRYKYALSLEAMPYLARNLANIVKSLCGLNKKCIALDLDNTLWGGIIGDAGLSGINISKENASGEAYYEFQEYLKLVKETGVLLGVVSKNEEDVALSAFDNLNMPLQKEDFSEFIANWEPKSLNLKNMAENMNLGIDFFIFVDDNPVECDEVATNTQNVETLLMNDIENYISKLDSQGYFENTIGTDEDKQRTQYYRRNKQQKQEASTYQDYEEYLKSLDMQWEFHDFEEAAISRITQLLNKTNQFNLTTLRLSQNQIVEMTHSKNHLCIQGRMKDKFGDNGLVTLVIGEILTDTLHIDIWLMSCRVFRRNGEYLLFQYLKKRAIELGLKFIKGKFIPSKKNKIVANFYESLHFQLKEKKSDGSTIWQYNLEETEHIL